MVADGRLPSPDERLTQLRWEHEIPLALHQLPKPVVAALPGAAAGAGLSLALSCDLRVLAESAFVTTSYARLGLSGDYGGSWFLTRLVGTAKARELYFTAERIDASECLRLGLANRVVPDADLAGESLALARRIAAGPPVALRWMKDNLNRALGGDLRDLLDLEAERMVASAQTEDYLEAVRAFAEKRSPEFRGR
jgi:2-(1,2-epoxy-1,2-dihydrophenyl)acetyl-CoA isomerase